MTQTLIDKNQIQSQTLQISDDIIQPRKIEVHKYGGSSLGTRDKILSLSQHLAEKVQKGHQLVVVLSAMQGYTDQLLLEAQSICFRPPKREVDMLISVGERISSSLMSIALSAHQIKAISFTGSQVGIITDDHHGCARIRKIKPHRLLKALDSYDVVIIAGFQGVSEKTNEVTTLGRGGSDLTAVAVSIALGLVRCHIHTDVEGFFEADPREGPNSRLIPKLSWSTVLTATHYGAKVLHHRAAMLAARHRMEVIIDHSFQKDQTHTQIQTEPLEGSSFTLLSAVHDIQTIQIDCFKDTSKTVKTQSTLLTESIRELGYLHYPPIDLKVKKEENGWSLKAYIAAKEVSSLQSRFQDLGYIGFKSDPHEKLSFLVLLGSGFLFADHEIVETLMQNEDPIIWFKILDDRIEVLCHQSYCKELLNNLQKVTRALTNDSVPIVQH